MSDSAPLWNDTQNTRNPGKSQGHKLPMNTMPHHCVQYTGTSKANLYIVYCKILVNHPLQNPKVMLHKGICRRGTSQQHEAYNKRWWDILQCHVPSFVLIIFWRSVVGKMSYINFLFSFCFIATCLHYIFLVYVVIFFHATCCCDMFLWHVLSQVSTIKFQYTPLWVQCGCIIYTCTKCPPQDQQLRSLTSQYYERCQRNL